jgi:hypothetical protein
MQLNRRRWFYLAIVFSAQFPHFRRFMRPPGLSSLMPMIATTGTAKLSCRLTVPALISCIDSAFIVEWIGNFGVSAAAPNAERR